jgi:hypothetical protein
MFAMMHVRMPAKVAAAQMMEADIVLQETEEATRVEHLQALLVKFSTAAQSKFGSNEKGVSWSPQEFKFGPLLLGDSTAFTPPTLTPAVLVRGSKYRRSSNLDKPTTQRDKQVQLAATASKIATSLQKSSCGCGVGPGV